MHYTGIAAMRMGASLDYDRSWVAMSIFIAIGAATAAVWLAARDPKLSHRLAAAMVMGAAIAGMHYAGMRAAIFTSHMSVDRAQWVSSVDQTYLAVLISAITFFIFLMALGAARVERLFQRMARREARTALRLKIADVLRDHNTEQALHEVSALMGAHFGLSRTGYGQLDPAADIFEYDVCWTDGSVEPILGRYPAAAFGVQIVAALNAGQTVAIDDIFKAEISHEKRTRETALQIDTRAILVVPLMRSGQLRTIVYLNDRNPRVVAARMRLRSWRNWPNGRVSSSNGQTWKSSCAN